MSRTIRELPDCGAPTGCFSLRIVALTHGGERREKTRKNRDFSAKKKKRSEKEKGFLYIHPDGQWESRRESLSILEANNTTSVSLDSFRP